jgi:protein-disulfide isomerase
MLLTRQRLIVLSLFTLSLLFVSSLVVYRAVRLSKDTFPAGKPPKDVLDVIIPKQMNLTEMRPPAVLPTDHIRYGSATSVMSVIEYGDYECDDCKTFSETVNDVLPAYHGQVRFIWHDLPIEELHPKALEAALFAQCAGEQGVFWDAHDYLMRAERLTEGTFSGIAQQLRLNTETLYACRESAQRKQQIRDDVEFAKGQGIQGAPLIFVGTKAFYGQLSREELQQAIREFLEN